MRWNSPSEQRPGISNFGVSQQSSVPFNNTGAGSAFGRSQNAFTHSNNSTRFSSFSSWGAKPTTNPGGNNHSSWQPSSFAQQPGGASERGKYVTGGPKQSAVKRTVCKFFLEGRCNRGASCTYSHDTSTGSAMGWMDDQPSFNSTHPRPNQQQPQQQKVCEHYRRGTCRFGSRCKFLHTQTNAAVGGAAAASQSHPQLQSQQQLANAGAFAVQQPVYSSGSTGTIFGLAQQPVLSMSDTYGARPLAQSPLPLQPSLSMQPQLPVQTQIFASNTFLSAQVQMPMPFSSNATNSGGAFGQPQTQQTVK
uniref:Zinc finger CCCH domain-containing protein 42 n=2 Tax=Lygus hesperus TaxID=30085 RepID=A0A0A9ZGP4_LYGHE